MFLQNAKDLKVKQLANCFVTGNTFNKKKMNMQSVMMMLRMKTLQKTLTSLQTMKMLTNIEITPKVYAALLMKFYPWT